MSSVRELHALSEEKKSKLRQKHTEVFDEFEHVRLELDALSSELSHLTDHGVALDANFSRFGYTARIRTFWLMDVGASALD